MKGGYAGVSSVGASFCELEVLSRGSMAVALCHWIQSETDNTTENEVLFITWTIELHFNNMRLFSGNREAWQRQDLFILSLFRDQYVEALFHCVSRLSVPLQVQDLKNLYAGRGELLGLHYCTASTVSSQIAPPESTVSF